MPCDVPGRNIYRVQEDFCGPSSGVAAGAATRGYGRVPRRPVAEKGDKREWRGEVWVGGGAAGPNLEYGASTVLPCGGRPRAIPAPGLPHGTTWRETAGITPGLGEFRWGMPCDVPEGTPTGFRGYFCGPSPGVAAAQQPRAMIRFPYRERARWALCAVGEVGPGLGDSTSQLTLGRSPTRGGAAAHVGQVYLTCPGRDDGVGQTMGVRRWGR
jgi:hypothetical protein